uniref:NADH-ubiquinone oxidoreductase chain 2 n=1 Tax=Ophiotreta durbanensis TaxID=3135534 RepID=A0AAU6PWW8_9ECHI
MIIIFYNLSLILAIVILYFSTNWLVLWFLVELSTLSLVVLLSGRATPRGVESAVKYFVVQGVASVFLLFGAVFNGVWGGSLDLFSSYNLVSYFLIIIGLLVKLAVFPNPFWIVDVLSGVDLARGAYVILFSKFIPVYLYYIVSGSFLGIIITVVGVSSIIFGSVLGVNQVSVRKIIALSSVSHMGWIVLTFPLLSGSLCFFVFLSYIFMLVPLLWVSNVVSLDYLVKGKNMYYNWGALVVVLVCLLSLGGFPPLLGFFYKWVMFFVLVESGSFLVSGILILFNLVSLFFYLQLCHSLVSFYWPELKLSFFNGLGEMSTKVLSPIFVVGVLFLMIIVFWGAWYISLFSSSWF